MSDDPLQKADLDAQIKAGLDATLPAALEEATTALAETLAAANVDRYVREYGIAGLVKSEAELEIARNQQESQQGQDMVSQPPPMGADLGSDRVWDPKGLVYDPFTALDQMGYRARPSSITYATLAEMARRVPPYTAILQTRLRQMGVFAKPQPDDLSVGFKIELDDHRAEMTPDLEQRAYEIERWIMACGNPEFKNIKRPKFGKFIRMFTWDSLVYDQAVAEIIPDHQGRPAWWRCLDAATLRIADDLDDYDDQQDTVQYVQVYDDVIVAEFPEDELIFGVRNPRSDIRFAGYGTSELEMLITIVTAILWGIQYNSHFFSQGSVAKGILNFKGAVPENMLQSFRRQWYTMVTGVDNAFRTPVTNADDLQWIDLHQNNRDMEFGNWLNFLIKVTGGVVGISPEEFGFQFGNEGQTSTMNEGSQEAKIKYSKDKGLVPLAQFVAEELSDNIVAKIDPRFRISFGGINVPTPKEMNDRIKQEVETYKTVDEIRKERGMQPMAGGKGDVILNPVWLQASQAADQAAQGDMGGMPGMPGGPGAEEEDPMFGASGSDEDMSDDVGEFGEDEAGQPGQDQELDDLFRSETGPRVLSFEVDV